VQRLSLRATCVPPPRWCPFPVGRCNAAPNASHAIVGVRVLRSSGGGRAVLAAAEALPNMPCNGPAMTCGDDCEPCGGAAASGAGGELEAPVENLAAQVETADKDASCWTVMLVADSTGGSRLDNNR